MTGRMTFHCDMKTSEYATKRYILTFKGHDSYCYYSSFIGGRQL